MNLVALVEESEGDCSLDNSPADVNRVVDGSTALFGSTGVTIGRFLTIGNRTGASGSSAGAEARGA